MGFLALVSLLGGWLFDFRTLREGRLGWKLRSGKVGSLGVLTRLPIISFYKLLHARPQIKNTNPRWKNSRLTVAAIVRVESKNVYDLILHMK